MPSRTPLWVGAGVTAAAIATVLVLQARSAPRTAPHLTGDTGGARVHAPDEAVDAGARVGAD